MFEKTEGKWLDHSPSVTRKDIFSQKFIFWLSIYFAKPTKVAIDPEIGLA